MKRNLFWIAAMAAVLVSCGSRQGKERVTDVQAHRGGMGLYPEESLEAMLNAVDLGVNTLEMDLCITRDNVSLMHGVNILTLTNGLQLLKRIIFL